jgi:DNA-binding HxlR family transcriptional regulator
MAKFRTLYNERTFKILSALPNYVTKLQDIIGISQPALNRQMKKLQKEGLVKPEITTGRYKITYFITQKGEELRSLIFQYLIQKASLDELKLKIRGFT